MIEAILLDVDGTLTNGRKEITPKTEAALRAAEAAGIRLVLHWYHQSDNLIFFFCTTR